MGNIRVGKPSVKPTTPTHVKGVHAGNQKKNYKLERGFKRDGTSTARRSTGISSHKREPITPGAPNISPG